MMTIMDKLRHLRCMSRGRVYGSVATLLLIDYFVVPPIADLSKRACLGSLICPTKVERGIYEFFAAVTTLCLLAGFLISREIDKYPEGGSYTALAIFTTLSALFGGTIWLMLHAAFW